MTPTKVWIVGCAILSVVAVCGPGHLGAQGVQSRPELVVQSGHSGLQSPGLQIERVTFSPDNRLIATADNEGAIRIWEVASGRQLQAVAGRSSPPYPMHFSPDGGALIYADASGGLTIWSITERRTLQALRIASSERVTDVAGSSDGSMVAAVAGIVRIWDLRSRQQIGQIATAAVRTTIAFSPQTAVLAIREPRRVMLWSPTQSVRATIALRNRWGARRMVFLPGGATLAVPDGDRVVVIDVRTGRATGRIRVGENAELYPLSDSGRELVVGVTDRYEVWDIISRRKLRDLMSKRGAYEVPSPSWQWLAVQDTFGSRTIAVHELAGANAVRVLGQESSASGGNTAVGGSVAFSPDGSHLAMKSGSRFWVWDLASGEPKMYEGHKGEGHVEINALSFSGDGKRLVSGDLLWNMIEWDLASGRATRSVDLGWRKTALRHACSADGHWCASSDFARTDVLEVDTWRVDRSFPVGAIGLALTSDGTMIAAAGHFEVVIMNRRDGSRREFKGHRDQVATVAFSADDRLLASAAAGEVMVWDVSTGRELSAFHSGQRSVRCLAFSRDGRTLATAGDEVVRVWDPRTGQRRHVLEGHTNQVTGLAFSADGRFLVSGSVDGTTRIWDVERGTEVALLAVRKDSEDWVVITPDGIFDGSARGTETLVAWRVGMTMYPAERYFGQFFTPGLLAAIWRDAIPSGHSTIAGVPVPPALRILQGSGAVVKTPRMSLQVDVDGAATEVSLYHNGSRVASQPGTDTAAQYVFELDLVPGDNELRAVAVGEADVASNPETIRVTYDVPEPHRPSLYLLTIGVSRYRGPNWNLGFARDDAQALSEFFTNRAQKLFAKVDVNVLVDEQATRANILEAVASIGQRSRPEDVVLIYFAGHGLSIEQTYYLLPHEMRDETSLANDVRQFGVSDRLLLDSLRKIKALKRVLILDACGAAAATALEILARGPAAERAALEMLARAEGIFIIAASTPQQEALEIPELGHGVLTYAILRGLGAWGNPAEREVVTMHQLLSYISQKVPELAAQYGRRTRQVPVTFHRGMDFPLIVH